MCFNSPGLLKGNANRPPVFMKQTKAVVRASMRFRIVASLGLALLLLPATLAAATRTVTSLADQGTGSLREAIALAAPGDTININVVGTVILTSGELVLTRDLRVAGPGANLLSVSGNDSSRVFNVPSGVTAFISDLMIRNGSVIGADGMAGDPNQSGQDGGNAYGGGIYNAGRLTLARCYVAINQARGGRGGNGGINQLRESGRSKAGSGGKGGKAYGGGVFSGGSSFNHLWVTNCTFHANQAVGGDGGAGANGDVFAGPHGDIVSVDAIGANGGAGGESGGGALAAFNNAAIVNTTAILNTVQGGMGGAGGNGGHWVSASTFAGGNGGSGGHAGGAGIYATPIELIHCTVLRNSALSQAGGAGGAASTGCELFGCRAGSAGEPGSTAGGGLAVEEVPVPGTILNTLIAFNSCSPGGAGLDVHGPLRSLGHNLIGNPEGSMVNWRADDIVGPSPFDIPVSLLQDNGGPVPTVALLPGNIAIDAGDDAVLSSPYNLTTDERGRPRRVSSHVDIGAFEFGYVTRLVTTLSDDGGGSLRNALAIAGSYDRIAFAPVARGTIRLTSGELFVNKPVSIVGPGAGLLRISGNGTSRILHIGIQGEVAISGITVTEGRVVEANGVDGSRFTVPYTLPTPGGYARGGGILNEGQLRMTDCMILSNSVQGGIGGGGFTVLLGPVVGGETGGPGVGAGIFSAGDLELRRCTLAGNRATGGAGGIGGLGLLLSDTSAPGVGGYASGAAAYAAAGVFDHCIVAGNVGTGGPGGRGAPYGLVEPYAYGPGGPGGPSAGGGLSGGFVMTNCTISANAVIGGAGGTGGTTGTPGATFAGGVNAVQLAVQSSIIAGNFGAPDVYGGVTSLGWNLIGITDGSSGWDLSDVLGNAMFPVEPRLSPCQDNGGAVWTMVPLPGSPARDAGSSPSEFDARGGRRIVDFPNVPNGAGSDGSDIGAAEVDSLLGPLTLTKTGTVARVKFKSDPGNTYRLLQTSVLTNRVWTNVVTLPGTGKMLEAIDSAATAPQRLYRVRSE